MIIRSNKKVDNRIMKQRNRTDYLKKYHQSYVPSYRAYKTLHQYKTRIEKARVKTADLLTEALKIIKPNKKRDDNNS